MGYVFAIFGIPVAVFSVLGNLLTIIVVFKTRTLRSRHSVVLTTSLAFCDLLFSLLCCPVNYITTLREQKELNEIICSINGFLGVLFCLTSILTLSILSFDRYIAIIRPLRYNMTVTSARVKMIIISKWIFAALIASVPLSGWGRYTFYPQKGFCFIDYNKDFGAFIFIGVWFNICFGFISFSYYHIFKAARRQRKEIRNLNIGNVVLVDVRKCYEPGVIGANAVAIIPATSFKELPSNYNVHSVYCQRKQIKIEKKENKAAFTIFAIIGAFAVCWTPFVLINFTSAIIKYNIPQSVDVISTLLVAVGSCVNPLFYGWLDSAFRSAFKRILFPLFQQVRGAPVSPDD